MLFVPRDWLSGAANLFLFFLLFSGSLTAQDTAAIQCPMKLPEPDSQLVIKKKHPLISDSVQALFDRSPVVEKTPVFYYPHNLKAGKIVPRPNVRRQYEWAFLILFLCISGLAWTRYYFNRRFRQIFQVFLSGRYYNQLVRSGDVYTERISVNLFLIFVLTVPLLIFQFNYQYSIFSLPDSPFGNILPYSFILLGVLILYSLKMLCIHLCGLIFKTGELTTEYMITNYVFNLIEGLVLLPLLIVIVFTGSELFLQISIGVFFLVFIYRLLRSLSIGLKGSRYPIIYLLMFFLSIEILPLLVIWKLVANNYSH